MKQAFLLVAFGMLACTACDQTPPASQNSSQDNLLNFNPKNVQTYKGQILQILDTYDSSTSTETLGILMQTEKGAIPIVLGPRSFILGGPALTPGQQIVVTGSEIYLDGSILVIAQEMSVNRYSLKLRNEDGNPLWSGWHKN